LLAKYHEEGGEERSGETGIQYGLDLNDCIWRTGPLRKGGWVATERSVVHIVDEDEEEGGRLFVLSFLAVFLVESGAKASLG